jgi:hypothetical protein
MDKSYPCQIRFHLELSGIIWNPDNIQGFEKMEKINKSR